MAKRKKKRWTKTDTKAKPKMSAPLCKVCETRHWLNQPHHFEPKK